MVQQVAALSAQADYLVGGNQRSAFNLGSAGPAANNGVIYYCVSANPFDGNGVNQLYARLIDRAFQYLENITGIDFQKTTNANLSDIDFTDNRAGAYAQTTDLGADGWTDSAVVNIDPNWYNGQATDANSGYIYQTILHEILHTLGLDHMGPYNGNGSFASDAIFVHDSWQNSIMSYFSQAENPNIRAAEAFLQTAMVVDLLALDLLYGSQGFGGRNFGTSRAFTEDTVYGFNTTITEARDWTLSHLSQYAPSNAYCIVDGGGIDSFDFSGWSANQVINLTVSSAANPMPSVSSIGGGRGNLTLAVGTVIENATGGSGHDQITGNFAANALSGRAGNDTLNGGDGADTLSGGSGNDTYVTDGRDAIIEAAGGGFDTVRATGNITLAANIEALTVAGSAAVAAIGNAQSNHITGNAAANRINALGGADTLVGAGGNDTVIGGGGRDVLSGGTGADRFEFRAVTDSVANLTGCDLITDFLSGVDMIDLSMIDASALTAGDDAFVWRGQTAFGTGAEGEVRFQLSGSAGTASTVIYIDTDADSTPEMVIRLSGHHALQATDFLL